MNLQKNRKSSKHERDEFFVAKEREAKNGTRRAHSVVQIC